MFEKLELIKDRYDELEKLIGDPDIISNQSEWKKLCKEHSSYEEKVTLYNEYKSLCDSMAECEEIIGEDLDEEMTELAKEELAERISLDVEFALKSKL